MSAKSQARQQPPAAHSEPQAVDATRVDSTEAEADVVEFEFAPVTASEVRTKLELARTFLDMGDPASARHMLDEVMEEGDSALKKEAQQLIDSMP